MVTAIDEATMVQAIMHGFASGGATRRVVVAVAASATLRTHRGDRRGDGRHLSMHLKLRTLAKDYFEHEVGISQLLKRLRQNDYADLAEGSDCTAQMQEFGSPCFQ